MLTLRDYQRACIDALYAWFLENPTGNPLLVLPTGAGKAVILAALIREALEAWPQTRILMLTHVRELIAQNAHKLVTYWPQAPLGIYSAGLRRRDTFDPIIFAGIQSVHDKAMRLGRFDLILVDECHLINHEAQGTYRRFLTEAQRINPHLRIVGLSATPFRTGHGSMMAGDDALFHGVAYQIGMLDLIAAGYLSPLVTKATATQLDVSGVQIKQGEYAAGQLERAVDVAEITAAALDEIAQYGADRRRWLIFCAGVRHAEHVAETLIARGIKAGCVTGKTPTAQRDALIAQYRSGHLRALTSMGVLTTGFDAPETDLLACLRPTCSPGLWVQMVGRGMRIAQNKQNCMILDFAGNTLRHGPVDQIEAWTPRPKDGGDAPAKTCPECQTIVATAVRQCPTCGYAFPFDEQPKHAPQASVAPILSSDTAPRLETHAVSTAFYHIHPSRYGGPPTLRVDYYDRFMRIASEWVCFSHEGYARTKAVAWWAKRAPGTTIPQSVAEAHARAAELRQPTAITIDTRPKYPEIKHHVFNDAA